MAAQKLVGKVMCQFVLILVFANEVCNFKCWTRNVKEVFVHSLPENCRHPNYNSTNYK